MGAFAAMLLIGGGWVMKILLDQQKQFFESLIKRLDANTEKIGELADAVKEVVIGERRRA
jgi:hypothetical protein